MKAKILEYRGHKAEIFWDDDEKIWIGHILSLDLTIEGETLEDVTKDFKETLGDAFS